LDLLVDLFRRKRRLHLIQHDIGKFPQYLGRKSGAGPPPNPVEKLESPRLFFRFRSSKP
jgi:hypothetical protein